MRSMAPAKAQCCLARSSPRRGNTAWSITAISILRGEVLKRRVAILISGRGSNMMALIEAAAAADFPAEIAAVISNRAGAAGLARARERGIATLVIESKTYGSNRAAFEAKLQAALDQHRVELI